MPACNMASCDECINPSLHPYTGCKGNNPVSAPGVGGNGPWKKKADCNSLQYDSGDSVKTVQTRKAPRIQDSLTVSVERNAKLKRSET